MFPSMESLHLYTSLLFNDVTEDIPCFRVRDALIKVFS